MSDFAAVVRAQRDGLYRFAWLLTGDQWAAEDVVAEAVASAFVASRRRDIGALDRYLRQSVVNEVRGGIRKRVVAQRFLRTVRPQASEGMADRVAETDRLHAALLTLPVRQRAAVVLRYYEDRSERDIAELMGTSTGTVKTHLSRGLQALRLRLAEDDAFGGAQ